MWLRKRRESGDDARSAEIRELREEIERLRLALARSHSIPDDSRYALSDEQREVLIKRARAELPMLREQVEQSLAQLRRIAAR